MPLNAQTQRIVTDLLQSKITRLGGITLDPLGAAEKALLELIAIHLVPLSQEKGGELLQKVLDLRSRAHAVVPAATSPTEVYEKSKSPWRLAKLRTFSFRGLAPARYEWSFDFGSRSHLLFGPNGSGKSSLLGAIVWCFTGRLIRDDQAPEVPENIVVFTTSETPAVAGERPDGLALTDSTGVSTDFLEPFWVALQLVGLKTDGHEIRQWLRRHNTDGLAISADGVIWAPVKSIDALGISDFDAELQLLMPARLPHLRFGKDPDLVQLFSQIVGLDDLETLADVAARLHAAASREKTTLAKRLNPLIQQSNEHTASLKSLAIPLISGLPLFVEVGADDRTLETSEAFGKELVSLLGTATAQLATDLGIELSGDTTSVSPDAKRQLDNLPGEVTIATQALEGDLSGLFPSVFKLSVPSEETAITRQGQLEKFEQDSRRKIRERLDWAHQSSPDLDVLLEAAKIFPAGSRVCPVCKQDLQPVPAVRDQLEQLRPLAVLPHLHQEITDLERALTSELAAIVSNEEQREGARSISERLSADWTQLKSVRFPGLLRKVADKLDVPISQLASSVQPVPDKSTTPLAVGFEEEFPGAFSGLDHALAAARHFLTLAISLRRQLDHLRETLAQRLSAGNPTAFGDSLAAILCRGNGAISQIRAIETILRKTRELYKSDKERYETVGQIQHCEAIMAASKALKGFAVPVRNEIMGVLQALQPQFRAMYANLYPNEMLPFDLLTTGHAANPRIKDEVNLYLRAGTQRVPVGPFANAGRLRALALCFVFALLERSTKSLALLVLDDPALSLDDDHKCRLLDHLIQPCLAKFQVILATHYETFFKRGVPVFDQQERLQLVPKRRSEDVLAFEPTDLLARIEKTLAASTCSWRDAGTNLRRWVERTMHTISAYCPTPFVRFNDVPGSITAYAAISDPRVATNRRDTIVASLKEPALTQVMHRLAHDEDPTETELRDGLACLKKCQKQADAEIDRLKKLFQHDVVGRAIDDHPSLTCLQLPSVFGRTPLIIRGAAAAAHNGVGVTWEEETIGDLSNHALALMKADTIAPIALLGQYLLLDPTEQIPRDGNLAVVETEEGQRYVRRVWRDRQGLYLEATNPTVPYEPIKVRKGECSLRRIVGILFAGASNIQPGRVGEEWLCPANLPTDVFKNITGVRVVGTSLMPLARDRQIVLVRHSEVLEKCARGTLACVDMGDDGVVIKRCYPGDETWILTPINPVELEDPMNVAVEKIVRVYPLVGVLFELAHA